MVGVGNIYAKEAFFKAGILPTTKALDIDEARMNSLTNIIKKYLIQLLNKVLPL